MKDIFSKLIESYVVPNNPKIESYNVTVLGAGEYLMYTVQIKSRYEFDYNDRTKIRRDVEQAFSFLGLTETSEYMITFSKVK